MGRGMTHEHDGEPISDAEMVEVLRKQAARQEEAFSAAIARDGMVCRRCLQLGVVIAQIMAAEALIEQLGDMPGLQGALHGLYALRESYYGHHPIPPVQ